MPAIFIWVTPCVRLRACVSYVFLVGCTCTRALSLSLSARARARVCVCVCIAGTWGLWRGFQKLGTDTLARLLALVHSVRVKV